MSNLFSKKFVSARKLISYLKDYFASGNSFCWRGPVETVTKQLVPLQFLYCLQLPSPITCLLSEPGVRALQQQPNFNLGFLRSHSELS